MLCAVVTMAESSFTAFIGTNFFNYERTYLTTGIAYLPMLEDQLELNMAAAFNIYTESNEAGTVVNPYFLIPANLGLNFLYPGDTVAFLFGIGLTPVLSIRQSQQPSVLFYMGPYLKAEVRAKVHRIMSLILELQQDLLIGGPTWVNTSTRISAGVNFTFSPRD
jgi:hypothetical protein